MRVRGSRHGVLAGLGCAAFLASAAWVLLAAEPARAAFESSGGDPVALGLGSSGAAWSLDGRPSFETPFLFGVIPRGGVSVATTRWDAAPELVRNGVLAWLPLGRCVVSARGSRLELGSYSETSLAWEIARLASAAGWGWAISAGRAGWAAGDLGATGWILIAGIGYAPRSYFRGALHTLEPVGSEQIGRGALEFSLTADPAPGWRLGSAYETARGGGFGRLKLGAECRPTGQVFLRFGLVPSDDTVSVGLGFRKSVLAFDLGRRSHPRLGAIESVGVTLGGGRRS